MTKIEFIERYGEEAYQRRLEYKKQYRETHREQIRERDKKYRETYKEQIIERQKKWRETHKEQRRETKRNYERNKRHMFAYCIPEQIEQIENYDSAKKDNFKGWCIHHRFECVETGGKVIRTATAKELQELGLYYNRPASELIFLTVSEHTSLHNRNRNNKDNIGGMNYEW